MDGIAVIAAIGSFGTLIFQFCSLINQKKENKKNLDANITCNARIEWIQNVRRVTAEFITAAYKYMGSVGEDEKKINFNLVQEKKSLLILYFGHDDINFNNKAQDIFDKNSNNAKNEMVIKLINDISHQLRDYFFNKNMLDEAQKRQVNCLDCESPEKSPKTYICTKEGYDGDILYFDEDDCKEYKKEINQNKEIYSDNIEALQSNINKFTEAMRIYLKLEWNRAKKRDE